MTTNLKDTNYMWLDDEEEQDENAPNCEDEDDN